MKRDEAFGKFENFKNPTAAFTRRKKINQNKKFEVEIFPKTISTTSAKRQSRKGARKLITQWLVQYRGFG